MARSALSLLSYCQGLDLAHRGSAVTALELCGKLSGDRNAAATVMNRLQDLESAMRAEHPDEIDRFLAPDAVIDWNGDRRVEKVGEASIGQFWLDRLSESRVEIIWGHLVVAR